jgi:hypothetical protein
MHRPWCSFGRSGDASGLRLGGAGCPRGTANARSLVGLSWGSPNRESTNRGNSRSVLTRSVCRDTPTFSNTERNCARTVFKLTPRSRATCSVVLPWAMAVAMAASAEVSPNASPMTWASSDRGVSSGCRINTAQGESPYAPIVRSGLTANARSRYPALPSLPGSRMTARSSASPSCVAPPRRSERMSAESWQLAAAVGQSMNPCRSSSPSRRFSIPSAIALRYEIDRRGIECHGPCREPGVAFRTRCRRRNVVLSSALYVARVTSASLRVAPIERGVGVGQRRR